MKQWKIVASVFLFSCILSICNVKADSYMNFSDIKISAMQGTYTASGVKKTTRSDQYIKTIDARDSLSNDRRNVVARVKGVSAPYVTTKIGSYVKLSAGAYNKAQNPNTYQLELKANRWTPTYVRYWGSWVLDDYLKI